MPIIFSGVIGFLLGLFTSSSVGWLKWLIVLMGAFYIASKMGVIK